jgi:hypothetical protein
MFEIGVFAFILFALGYWATLFIMGRREDVLHGQFVEAEPELAGAGASVAFLQPLAPPMRKAELISPVAPVPPAVIAEPAVVPAPVSAPSVEQAIVPSDSASATAAASAATTSSDADAWDSLLASLKLELKNAAQI